MRTQYKHELFLLPRVLTVILIIGITVYTRILFSHVIGWELLAYLTPSLLLLILLQIGWKHEKFGGVLFLLCSFGFLLIYLVQISFPVFLLLIIIGVLFLVDDHMTHQQTLSI